MQWKKISEIEEYSDFTNFIINEIGEIKNEKTGNFLTPVVNQNGYVYISICQEGKRKNIRLHRLIGLLFIPNPNNYLELDHIDRDRTNNSIENLRWVNRITNVRNSRDCFESKIIQLSKEGEYINTFETITEAAKSTGVALSSISRCVRGLRASAGGFDWREEPILPGPGQLGSN